MIGRLKMGLDIYRSLKKGSRFKLAKIFIDNFHSENVVGKTLKNFNNSLFLTEKDNSAENLTRSFLLLDNSAANSYPPFPVVGQFRRTVSVERGRCEAGEMEDILIWRRIAYWRKPFVCAECRF